MTEQRFIETSQSFFVDSGYVEAFKKIGIASFDALFSFNSGKDPGGSSLPEYRSRLQFNISDPEKILFLKRYNYKMSYRQNIQEALSSMFSLAKTSKKQNQLKTLSKKLFRIIGYRISHLAQHSAFVHLTAI